MLTRRQLAMGATATAWTASGLALMSPTRAYANPASVVIIAAATAAQWLASKANRGDGGLSGFLTSIRDLQVTAIEELTKLEQSVAEVSREISQLPDRIDGLFDKHEVSDFNAKISGAVDEFRELVAARRSTKGASRSRAWSALEQRKAETLRNRVVEARQVFSNMGSVGAGPHAAILACTTLPLELNSRFYIGEQKTVISVALDTYEAWRLRMLDSSQGGSIPQFINRWASAHESRLQAAISMGKLSEQFLRKSAIAAAPLASRAWANFSGCNVYEEYRPPEKKTRRGLGSAKEGDVYFDEYTEPEQWGHATMLSEGYSIVVQEIAGAKVFRLASSEGGSIKFGDLDEADQFTWTSTILDWQEAPFLYDREDDFAKCTRTKAGFAAPEERLKVLKADPAFGYASLRDKNAQFCAALASVNEARYQLSFGAAALIVAIKMKDLISGARENYA